MGSRGACSIFVAASPVLRLRSRRPAGDLCRAMQLFGESSDSGAELEDALPQPRAATPSSINLAITPTMPHHPAIPPIPAEISLPSPSLLRSGARSSHGKRSIFISPLRREAKPRVIVSSVDGGASWSRLATLPQRVVLLTAHDSGLIAISGSAAWRIAPDGTTTELGSIANRSPRSKRGAVRRRSLGFTPPAGMERSISPRIPA